MLIFLSEGKDSDADEQLVRKWAKEHGVKIYVKKFDTRYYAKRHSLSIEMAARDLRYSWFYKLMTDHKYNYLAVAHNANDNAETLLLNLVRGTGIKGLQGIREKRDVFRHDYTFRIQRNKTSYDFPALRNRGVCAEEWDKVQNRQKPTG